MKTTAKYVFLFGNNQGKLKIKYKNPMQLPHNVALKNDVKIIEERIFTWKVSHTEQSQLNRDFVVHV